MDCNRLRRGSDIGEESPVSHENHSDHDDDMRDLDSTEENGHHLSHHKSKMSSSTLDYVNTSLNTRGDGIGSIGASGLRTNNIRSPLQNTDLTLSHPHHPQFPPNHPLGALTNFMGITGLHNLPNLPNGDVLEKLKMQVRDMKVGLMDQDFSPHGFPHQSLTTPPNTAFTLPTPNLSGFVHHSQNLSHQSQSSSSSSLSHQQQSQQQNTHQNNSHSMSNGYPFTSPNAPCTKDANPASNSSTSSEASNSSQQNNGWSFEEQYKQVRQVSNEKQK